MLASALNTVIHAITKLLKTAVAVVAFAVTLAIGLVTAAVLIGWFMLRQRKLQTTPMRAFWRQAAAARGAQPPARVPRAPPADVVDAEVVREVVLNR